MRVVVLGAGTVGTWIAELLCRNRHSVTVVDSESATTKRVNTELDVRVVTGSEPSRRNFLFFGILLFGFFIIFYFYYLFFGLGLSSNWKYLSTCLVT